VSIAYLDTHVAVFLHDGLLEELSSAAKLAIENNELLVSPMVVLELEYLHARKKISVNARALTAALAETFGVAVCAFPFPAVVSESLGQEWVSDPFDRLIVGHAAANRNSPLITRDRLIRRHYASAVW
jgi:PIN domain nuclease of toxin-antitoxin system